jgi:Xaa-Pro aminopeptidase
MQGMRGVQGVLGIPQPVNEPMFTLHERDRRWARLRELMDRDGVDLLIVLPESITSDALYIADTAGVTIFRRDGDPILVLGGESSNYAVEQPHWIEERVSATERGSTAVEYGSTIADLLRRRGLTGLRTAVAGLSGDGLSSVRQPEGYAVYTTVRRIAEAVSPGHLMDGTGLLGRARYVKGAEEIARLAASVRLGEASVEAMAATAGAGVPQAEVFGQMLLAQVRAGADALHVAWAPGFWGDARHRYVTTPPGLLRPGTYVSTELMPEIRGYQAQVAQPMVIGRPCARAREIFDRNAAAFDAALAALRPGRSWGDVLAAVEAAAGSGDGKMFPLLHGRGLGNDGPLLVPGLNNMRVPDEPILANTTFILKPYLHVPEAPASFARHYCVTWGDTIIVTDTGARRLGTRKRELIAIDEN